MPTITFKCTEAQKLELEERSSGNVSDYIRKIVFGHLEQEDAFESIMSRLDQMAQSSSQAASREGKSSSFDHAILVELLLLMRFAVSPETYRKVTGEVERVGLQPWSSDAEMEKSHER